MQPIEFLANIIICINNIFFQLPIKNSVPNINYLSCNSTFLNYNPLLKRKSKGYCVC